MLEKILQKLDQIPLLPQNIHRLIDIVNDPRADTSELVKVVEQDPSLAMQALHLCNSAYYSLPVQVTSVSHAVRFLGMDTVAGLAMAAYFQSMTPIRGSIKENPWLEGLKDHLLFTAQLSEYLAKSARCILAPATIFTAGLLHDVGKLVLSKLSPTVAMDVHNYAEENESTLLEAEQEVLGADHAAVGYQLAIKWQLPEVLMETIRFHHDPFAGESDQTLYVFLANKIAAIPHDENHLKELIETSEILTVSKKLGFTTKEILGFLKNKLIEE
jgi:putative nucleotidyltransferase with HDIG domain